MKSYIKTVGSRLGKAFSMEEFSTEEQLEFWELSAEHVSRKQVPSFSDIVNWMDLLYAAPVHFVYKKEGDKLILDRRHVIPENILGVDKSGKSPHKETPKEKEYIKDFEYQLESLEKKMEMDEVFLEHGISSHSIGQCEHLPLFKKEGDLWGIYCAGPNAKSPEMMSAKLSIVGRMLSNWFRSLEEVESSPKKEYDRKIQSVVSDLGTGQLNTEAIAQLILRYVVNGQRAEAGCVVEFEGAGHKLIASVGMEEEVADHFTANTDEALFELSKDKLIQTETGEKLFAEWGKDWDSIYFKGKHHSGFLVILKTDKEPQFDMQEVLGNISDSLAYLFDYRAENEQFSIKLTDSYFNMLRAIEKSREKTKYHTPRMIAFAQRFGMFFGLDDDEIKVLTQTAKLHDIGYVGAASIEPGKSIGGELTHPTIGANLVEQLSIDKDVAEGIKTHHEWVNGNGTPSGITTDSIPWTGKIVGLFEYVVDFVETHGEDTSKTGEEWMEILSKGIMERADVEFDMVLVPTAIQLLQALGWEGCVNLGVD